MTITDGRTATMVIGGKQPSVTLHLPWKSGGYILWATLYLCWADMVATTCTLCVCCGVTDGGGATMHKGSAGAASVVSNYDEHTAMLPYTDSCSETGYCDYKQLYLLLFIVLLWLRLWTLLNCLRVADTVSFKVADWCKMLTWIVQFVNNTSNSEDLVILTVQGSYQFISQFLLILHGNISIIYLPQPI